MKKNAYFCTKYKLMMNPLVSIGIPVYNVELYIEKCLLSVFEQTYQNLEILIIDDCGSDSSMKIVADLMHSHRQGNLIKVIHHQNNKGLGEARNTAIDYAQGDYLYFLDSDDYIEKCTIEKLLHEAKEYDTDVVMASSRKIIYGSGEELPTFVYKSKKILKGKDVFAEYLCQDLRWHIGINAWNNLFNLDFLRKNNIRFAARKDEDALFLSDFYSEIECAVLLPDITYNYVIRPGSIMGYMTRQELPIREIRERFATDAIMTDRCRRLKGRSFYDVHCARVMKHKFRAVCVALRHRKRFSEPLANREIHEELRYPVPFSDIMSFRKYFLLHCFFFFLYSLPATLSVRISYVVGKLIRWI